jgi:NAD(P)-dependent dehydrogenase (short-subunit alcohol dehydrogenase family)
VGRIHADLPDANLVVHQADISDLDSVRVLAEQLGDGPLHALIHNAGVIPAERTLSAQGHEMAFATHVLGPLALTVGLREQLQADGNARVIWVSSGGMYSAPLVHDLEFANGDYSGVRAYARTKRMQVVLAELLAEHFAEPGDPVVHSMHPGWAATPGITGSIPGFARLVKPILRTPAGGADTAVWLAAADLSSHSSGRFWHDRSIRPTHLLPWQHDDRALRDHLWQVCVEAVQTGGPRS